VFVGIVDLIKMKAIIWHEKGLGVTYNECEVPQELLGEATLYRENLLETVSEFDDSLMEKYVERSSLFTRKERRI